MFVNNLYFYSRYWLAQRWLVYYSVVFFLLFYSRGVLANCADFFGFTCCQPAKVDWTKTYDLPRNYSNVVALASEEEKSHSVKIPLPFSSTWDPSDKTQHRR